MKLIYIKIALLAFLIMGPAAGVILYSDFQRLDRLLDQHLTENFRQVASQFRTTMADKSDAGESFDVEGRRILERYNSETAGARMVQAALYRRVGAADEYRLARSFVVSQADAFPLMSVSNFGGVDRVAMKRVQDSRFTGAVPLTPVRGSEYVLFFQAVDGLRAGYLQGAVLRDALFWAGAIAALLIFISMFVIHSEFTMPLKYLVQAVSEKRKSALDPDNFGVFGDLVRTIEDVRHAAENPAEDPFVDVSTGFASEIAAPKLYDEARQSKDELYLTLFSVNFAAEYVKAFGRANQSLIRKLTGQAIETSIPKTAPKAIAADYMFFARLTPKEFRAGAERIIRKFNEGILTLYEIGQGKQVPIQTISIFAISNRAQDAAEYEKAVEQFRFQWSGAIEAKRGGWAILTSDGDIETADGKLRPASSYTVAVKAADVVDAAEAVNKAEPDADEQKPPAAAKSSTQSEMDPGLARKMFIVKLCKVAGIKPRLAAQVYSAGWRKPDVLLHTKIHELTERAGLESQQAADLIANLRKVPKDKLTYGEDDYRDVFMTDVRMIRKIPRESLGRWFEAGYKRLEDLARASADDLARLDGEVPAEDIQAVVSGARESATK